MNHTDACKQQQAAHEAFRNKWPNACPFCAAMGYKHFPGSREEPPSDDECGHCVAVGKCPRCAGAVVFEEHEACDYARCGSCGWDEWKVRTGEQPLDDWPDVDCSCWEQEETGA